LLKRLEKEEGRRKREEGRGKKEEGRRKREKAFGRFLSPTLPISHSPTLPLSPSGIVVAIVQLKYGSCELWKRTGWALASKTLVSLLDLCDPCEVQSPYSSVLY